MGPEQTTAIMAALLSPLLMAVGFFIWDVTWNKSGGSAFSLNLFKCNLASLGFLIVISVNQMSANAVDLSSRITLSSVLLLILSGILGIVIGDVAWLEALRIIGATRVLFIDSIKPFTGALMGCILLKEPIDPATIIGMTMTVTGILYLSLEKDNPNTNTNSDNNDTSFVALEQQEETNSDSSKDSTIAETGNLRHGYLCAIGNVMLDTCGSFLTKKYGKQMSTWEVNCIRFGSSGGILALVSIACTLFAKYNSVRSTDLSQEQSKVVEVVVRPWFWLPVMRWKDWGKIMCGVLFVTFLTPALSNYALFKITLAQAFTLGSITPLYALILEWIVRGKRPSVRSTLSGFLAAGGVAVLNVSK